MPPSKMLLTDMSPFSIMVSACMACMVIGTLNSTWCAGANDNTIACKGMDSLSNMASLACCAACVFALLR